MDKSTGGKEDKQDWLRATLHLVGLWVWLDLWWIESRRERPNVWDRRQQDSYGTLGGCKKEGEGLIEAGLVLFEGDHLSWKEGTRRRQRLGEHEGQYRGDP